MLETMHWPDEIREPEFEELGKKVDVRDTEVKMARQLIQQLSDDFNPRSSRTSTGSSSRSWPSRRSRAKR